MAAFPDEEYVGRLARTRTKMAEAGVDALIITDPANMNYLTGYDAWSFYVPQAVIVPATNEAPLWFGRAMDAPTAVLTTTLPRDHILSWPDHYVENPPLHPFQHLAKLLAERGLDHGRIGYEGNAYFFTARSLQVLQESMSRAKFDDIDLMVNWVRTIKSEREIDVFRQAARIMERVMRVAIDAVNVGTRQCDAAALISQAQIAGTKEFGGEAPANPPSILSAENAATPHASWTDQPFRRDTATCLELSACRLRYHCPMSRTVWLGKPPDEMLRLAEATKEGYDAALATVRAGAICRDVHAAWNQVITKHGFSKPSRIGYSVGLNYPPNWADHTASLRGEDTTVMQPNMVFHMILGMWMEGWGFELSDTFRVTETGHEVFADFPRQLFVKD